MSKVAFSSAHSSLSEIAGYYSDSEYALEAFYFELHPGDRFLGYSKEELQEELKERKQVLDRMCSLDLLAAIEARLRIDYLMRCQKKYKDALSREFRRIYKEKENKASLVGDILKHWKRLHPVHKARLDNFQKVLDYRNWLAHGRYWQPNRSPHIFKYDYLEVYMLTKDILGGMELVEG